LLDVRVVQKGDNRKFTSKFKGPYRIIKVIKNRTVEIADSSFKAQLEHCNRLKPLYETMLWTDEAMPPIESTIDPTVRSRKNLVTQPNCNSDEEADDERDELNNIDSDSPEEIDDPPLLDKAAENPDHIEISLPNPDSIVRNDSPMNVPIPRP
jgi:hypothetical protein